MLRATLPLLLALLLSTGLARADDKDAAREAFQAGVKAFQAGDYKAALEKFQAADRALHSAAITYNVARALEKLERMQRAVDAYEAYIAEAGEGGEFTNAATVAIAQIKSKSTRLRIESTPPGASVRIDGELLATKTPVSVLVARGTHEVALELDTWREARAYDAPGGGSTGELVFVRSELPKPAPAPAAPPEKPPPAPAPPEKPKIDGLLGSAGLSLSAYRFVGSGEESSSTSTTTAESNPGGLVFGLAFDVGYALSSKTALMLRAFGGLGSSEASLASLGAGALVASVRTSDRWWLGGGLAIGGGRAEADATRTSGLLNATQDSQVTFETSIALGPSLELGYVIDQNEDGHWLVSLMPTVLLTTSGEESTLFIPLMLGYRWF